MKISTIQDIIADLQSGKMVILVDEEDRENEGDLVLAADFVSPEAINFMATYGRGLICLTLTEERCRQLNLPLMVASNRSPHGTNFTLSIEAASGVTTGISAADRATTIQAAVKADAKAEDIARKLKDNELLAPALMNKANIYSWRGKTSSSVKTYKECLGLKGHLTPRSLGGVYSNLSSVLYESGEYSESLALQCKAIEVFKKNGRPMNLSIAHTHMVFILLELKDFAKGIEHCEIARHQAEIDEYKRGLAVTELLMGVLLANIKK